MERLNREIRRCTRCARLVAWRERVAREKRRAYQGWDYWGRPVPGFGDPRAGLLILGLAPAAHGANRTGRMFTGDGSAGTLMAALHRAGLANRPHSEHLEDGLRLEGVYLTAVVRCVPPRNRPTAAEVRNCRPFLRREMACLPEVRVVLTLGRVAFEGYRQLLKEWGLETAALSFRHGASYPLPPPAPGLVASYHPSRYNTQTGRLTPTMLDHALSEALKLLAAGRQGGDRLSSSGAQGGGA